MWDGRTLTVFPLRLPPLRDRGSDVAVLAQHFLASHNKESGTEKILTEGAIEQLAGYLWPGNVRELRNVIHRAFIMANDVIDEEQLPPNITDAPKVSGPTFMVRVGQSIAAVEKQLIEATLFENGGQKERSAELLGVSLKTLYNRLAEYRQNEQAPINNASNTDPDRS